MFMFLSTDSFSVQNAKKVGTKEREDEVLDITSPGSRSIRRPYRGIQIKEDTYSTLSIRKPDGNAIPLVSSSDRFPTAKKGSVFEYADYILQRVDDQRTEKQQVIETFGDPFVYFFGERPRVATFSGLLVSTEDFNWRSQFWKNYDESFRGTKLVQQNARAYISYDTIIIEGYPLAASAIDSAEEPYTIPFSLQMFVTGYYDWSQIGNTRFPGKTGFIDLDVLNKELEDQRSKFTSTTAKVRLMNLTSKGGGGLAASLRAGIKKVNDVVSLVDGVTDQIHNVIGGRVVRMPIGAAGYYQNAGEAVIGAGSIGGSAVFSSEGLGKQFDAATGQYKGVTGSVKLRMPSYSKYATPWTSKAANGSPIGHIFENSDEYIYQEPIVGNSKKDNLGKNKASERAEELAARTKEYNKQLAIYNQIAEAGGLLGNLASAVSFVKSSFGMVMTVASVAGTVSEVARGGSIEKALRKALGIPSSLRVDTLFASPVRTFEAQFRHALGMDLPDDPVPADSLQGTEVTSRYSTTTHKDVLNKVGVTSQSISPDTAWLGSSGSLTYQKALEEGTELPIGSAYNQSEYSSPDGSISYDPVYGDRNYSAISSDQEVKNSLDTAYGDLDEELGTFGTDMRTAVESTYESSSTSIYKRTPTDLSALLRSLQSTKSQESEDTKGIRGVEDDDSEIAPIL